MRKYESFADQDFYKLRDECKRNGTLFVDKKFPKSDKTYKWLRPTVICSNPKFYVSGVSRFDVKQGSLGNCWFLAAMANLTLHDNLFKSVVCQDNSCFEDNYCGIFHFRFWYFGKYVDVVIDDLLPTSDGKKLKFAKSSDHNEFWSALLEKAYAKLYGGYENLIGGFPSEAYEDFTGGVVECYSLTYATPIVFDFIKKSLKRNVFFSCTINKARNMRDIGLVDGHAYSITAAKTLRIKSNQMVNLLRVRNPWGAVEWTGAWSDKSKEWKYISDSCKKEIGLIVEDDGEFWIEFDDFKKYFDFLEICNVHPDIEMKVPHPYRKWNLMTFEGNFKSISKHQITLKDPDEHDDEYFCTVVIALMQKHPKRRKRDLSKIGFNILPMNNNGMSGIKTPKPKGEMREICHRFELLPGSYFLVPFHSNISNDDEYVLRVFYETKYGNSLLQYLKKTSDIIDIKRLIPHDDAKKLSSRISKRNRQHKSCTVM